MHLAFSKTLCALSTWLRRWADKGEHMRCLPNFVAQRKVFPVPSSSKSLTFQPLRLEAARAAVSKFATKLAYIFKVVIKFSASAASPGRLLG